MKVSKAIGILKNPLLLDTYPLKKDRLDALKLGVDALERLQASRKRSSHSVHALLIGETFEEVV